MPIFGKDSRVSAIIFHAPEILTVLNRFGIYLGVGDMNVDEAAEKAGINPVFLLTMLNTYLNEDYFPEEAVKNFTISDIVEYLAKTDTYWIESQLPNIDRHFHSLLSRSEDSSNLSLLAEFYASMAKELTARIHLDLDTVFPLLKEAEKSVKNVKDICPDLLAKIEDTSVEDKAGDLLTFFIVHLKGKYDSNLCRAVITTLFTLDKDIKQNNRIRTRILIPLLKSRDLI